jgi:hypothetical protein
MSTKLNPFRESSSGYKAIELVKTGTTKAKFIQFCEKENVGAARLFKNLRNNGYRNVAWKFIQGEDGSMRLTNLREVELKPAIRQAKIVKVAKQAAAPKSKKQKSKKQKAASAYAPVTVEATSLNTAAGKKKMKTVAAPPADRELVFRGRERAATPTPAPAKTRARGSQSAAATKKSAPIVSAAQETPASANRSALPQKEIVVLESAPLTA